VSILLAGVRCSLVMSYGKKFVLRAGVRGGCPRCHLFLPALFSVTERRLEELVLGYQQVIHNVKMLAGVKLLIITAVM